MQLKKRVGEYVLEAAVGAGMYGQVYVASSSKSPGQLFAVKMIPKKNMNDKVYKYLEREVTILHKLSDEHVVCLKDLKMTDNHYYIVFEYCNGGDLAHFLHAQGGHLPEPFVRSLLRQIVAGMQALHSIKAIHRDIKLSNLLLHFCDEEARKQRKPIVKLGDFGFARLVAQSAESITGKSISEVMEKMSVIGTPLHMAPEVLDKMPYSFKADIWSLGTVIYELLVGSPPFSGTNQEDLIAHIHLGEYKIPHALDLSLECLDFLNLCLQQDPQTRMGWDSLLQHPYTVNDGHTPLQSWHTAALPVLPSADATHLILSNKIRYQFLPISLDPTQPPLSEVPIAISGGAAQPVEVVKGSEGMPQEEQRAANADVVVQPTNTDCKQETMTDIPQALDTDDSMPSLKGGKI